MTQTMTATDSAVSHPVATRQWNWLVLPLTVAALAYLCIAMHSAISRVMTPWPMTPWESAIVVDAWRALHGHPVYTDPSRGHATLMYGPLGVFSNIPLIAFFGPDVRLTRVLPFVMSLTLCISAAWIFSRRGDWLTRVLIVSLCFLQLFRVRDWAVEARPDAAVLLLSFAALICFYRSAQAVRPHESLNWNLLGTAVMLIGFFFKQTGGVVGLVPPAMVLLTRPPGFWPRLTVALIPILAATATVLMLKLFWPWGYFYMIGVPGSYGVPLDVWLASLIELVRLSLLSLAAFFGWAVLMRRQQMHQFDRWLLVTAAVVGLFGAAARAKYGGYYNSHLPAMIALAIFSARALPAIFRLLATTMSPQAITLALLAPLLLVADVTAVTRMFHPGLTAPEHGDAHYRSVIKRIQRLKGRIVCPDDPSIPLLAKSYPGRSGQCELDANNQRVPATVRREIRSADWYVQVLARRRFPYSATTLTNLGFEPSPGILPPNSVYVLWKRSTPTTAPN